MHFYFNINTIVSRFALICATMNSFQPSISNHRNGKVFVAVLDGTYQDHQRMFHKVFRRKYEFSIHVLTYVLTYEVLSLLFTCCTAKAFNSKRVLNKLKDLCK